MPSRPQPTRRKAARRPAPRKRVRRIIPWGGILWLLVILNVTAGIYFSPLTATNRVRVVGAREHDEAWIKQAIQLVKGMPSLVADRTGLESKIVAQTDVKSARYTLNIFGRGVLRVVYRTPVAVLDEKAGFYLDDQGVWFQSATRAANLPEVSIPAISKIPAVGLMNGWDGARLANLCLMLTKHIPQVRWRVVCDDRSVISLTGNKMPRIVLGSTDDLDKKVERLASILSSQPEVVETAKEINLTAHEMPVYKQ